MSDQAELEHAIERARTAGNTRELHQLQDLYRGSGFSTTRVLQDGITLVEGSSPATVAATGRAGRSSAPTPRAPVSVLIAKSAHWDLREELRLEQYPTNEVGGWIFGRNTGVVLEVERFEMSWVEASYVHVKYDVEAALELHDRHVYAGRSLLGTWHTHLDASSASSTDLDNAMKQADHFASTQSCWLSLILKPNSYAVHRAGDHEQTFPAWGGGVPDLESWVAMPGHMPAPVPVVFEESYGPH